MNTSEKRRTRPWEMIAFLCEGLNRRRRWIFRIGCAALVLALIVCAAPFLLGQAAEDGHISGSDAVSTGDLSRKKREVSLRNNGTSAYIVCFAYQGSSWRMEGGNSERLSVILTALGIEGEVTGVSGGNEFLSVSENAGEWVVTSHKPGSDIPDIRVTAGGTDYTLTTYVGSVLDPLPDPDTARLFAYVADNQEGLGKVVIDNATPCGTEGCGGVYQKGSRHTVTAVPAEGCVFWGWQESTNWLSAYVSGFDGFNCPNPYELTLDGDKCLIACFLRESDLIPYIDEDGSRKVRTFATDLLSRNTGGWHYVYENTTLSSVDAVGDNRIILKDGVTLTVPNGIHVQGTLTIYGQDNQSGRIVVSTNSNNTPAIGGESAEIVVNGGQITFTTGPESGDQKRSDGIGGSNSTVTINRGKVTGSAYFNAIGGDNSTVTINGGSIDVKGGVKHRYKGKIAEIDTFGDGRQVPMRGTGAGIGGNRADVTITGGTVVAQGGYGGAGIGGASGANGLITISGGKVTASNTPLKESYANTNGSAAIGAGLNSAQGAEIRITGGIIQAVSYGSGAGIGAGGPTARVGTDGKGCSVIRISGEDTCVTATSIYGAGIGSSGAEVGLNNGSGASTNGSITIDGGRVCAISSKSGAGIGGGCKGIGGIITINGGYVISSGGSYSYSWIKENGFGSNDSPIFNDDAEAAFYGMIADLVLDLIFSGDYSGAGIGAGSNASGGVVRINGGTVVAIGGKNVCSAIGWGKNGSHAIDLGIYEYSKTTYGNLNNDGDVIENGVVYGGSNGVPVAKNNSYAKIEPCEHFLYFDLGGILPDPAPLKVTGAIVTAMPSLAGAIGYIFDGWYEDAGFTTPFDPDAPITGWELVDDTFRKTVHVKWKPAFTAKKVWEIDEDGKLKPESIQAVLQHYEPKEEGSAEKEWKQVGEPKTLNAENGWSADFPVEAEGELNEAEYRIRELDPDGHIVYASGAKSEVSYPVSGLENADKISYTVKYETGGTRLTTITNKTADTAVNIEKKWDVDLEGKDHPDSIQVVVQEKSGDKWQTVKTLDLSGENSWKVSLTLPSKRTENGQTTAIEYRVRELREETAFFELMNRLKSLIQGGKDKYDEWIGQLRTDGKSYWDSLPADIRTAADNGYDALLEKLNATPENLYQKLMDKLNNAMAEMRIVYDSKDPDKKESSDKNYEPNRVSYHVGEYTSALSGKTDAHVTRYKVDYKKSGSTYQITNQAILEIDNVKRWIGIGVDDKDMPEAAWLVLLYKPKEGALDNAGRLADAAGVDISGVLDYEFPVINTISGGRDPVSIISELVVGIDINIFNNVSAVPKLAIGRATKDGGWKVHYVVSKYTCGIPMEFKGAELGSEILRQVVKYLTGFDSPVSYNPFQNYFSIPTKAIRTFGGITDPKDLLDLSKLSGAAREKAESLTMDDIRNFGPETLLDDWRLMTNVINVKIDFDPDNDDEPDKVKGEKIWEGDNPDDRPDTLFIHVRNGDGDELEGSPIELKKSDFAGRNTWEWSLSLGKGDAKDDLIVSEEYPQDYAHKDKYLLEVKGFTLTNTWHEDAPDAVTVYGQKTWNDRQNADGLRPEKIIIHLLADGEELSSVETSEAGEWKWIFANLPRYKTASGTGEQTEIVYTISEDPVEGYETELNGYSVINTHKAGNTTVTVNKKWNDGANLDGIRPHSVTIRLLADGEFTGRTLVLSPVRNWTGAFTNLPAKSGGKPIEYTVEEVLTDVITGVDAEGTYAVEITASGNSFTVTNTHTPVNQNIEGAKTWDDSDNAAGRRPDSITVRLKADGEEIACKTVTETDGWQWTFYSLPIFDNGRRITYTITEDAVEDYTARIDGFNVTNRYTPGKTQVSVTKHWDDRNNHDGIRPDSVTIKLLADGVETGDMLVLSSENNWTGVFSHLDEKRNGAAVVYTVDEVLTDVITGTDGEGTYSVDITGSASAGFSVTNKHTPTREEPVTYRITYKLNGGTFDGSEADIVEIYDFGTEISIHKAPVRKGYTFDYWKGSEYHPDDAYTVTEDHTFIAQWKADSPPPDTPGTGENAAGITFSFALMLLAAYGCVYAFRCRKGVFTQG